MKYVRYSMLGTVMILLSAAPLRAQPDQPTVSMSVTLPDGQTTQLTAADSRVATATVSGVKYGFRPAIQDSRPWNHVTVTVFKMPTSREAIVELGDVDLKAGGSAIATKTTPSFKVAVVSVAPPENAGSEAKKS